MSECRMSYEIQDDTENYLVGLDFFQYKTIYSNRFSFPEVFRQ